MDSLSQQPVNCLIDFIIKIYNLNLNLLAGSLCEWKHKTVDQWMESDTFEDYQKTLILECDTRSQPSLLNWTVPLDAPNTLFYQVNSLLKKLY